MPAGVPHGTAMKIRYNKATLHRLPNPGVRWEWGDVVVTGFEDEDDPEKVAAKDAHAVRGLLDRHDDGRYSTTERLAEYLRKKYRIELTGTAGDAGQATLPGLDTGRRSSEARVAADGGTKSPFTNGSSEARQVTLTGTDATNAVKAKRFREAAEEHRDAADQDHASKDECAEQDAGQASLGAHRSRVRVGRLRRPTGRVYGGSARVTVDC